MVRLTRADGARSQSDCHFEETNDVRAALEREKEIKKWRREKKDRLVETTNPEWKDLSNGWA